MKKIILIVLSFLIVLSSCSNNKNGNKELATIESVSVVEESIPEMISLKEVDELLNQIKLEVVKSDDKKEYITLLKNMILESDLGKLKEVGNHQIKVIYEGFELILNLTISDYSVKVVYPDGTPVNGGVKVKWYDDFGDFTEEVNSNGIAVVKLMNGSSFDIILDNIPDGYTYIPNIKTHIYDKNIVIKLQKLGVIVEGDGNKESSYIVSDDVYRLSLPSTHQAVIEKYISFKALDSKTYNIISLLEEKDAKFALRISSVENPLTEDELILSGYIKYNFNYEFDAVKGETYNFIIYIIIYQTMYYETSFDFMIN